MNIAGEPQGEPFEKFYPLLEDVFRESWADNADRMSILYTGTKALKTDFTRTGKRTYKGAIDDGMNAIQRYYINNFCDGTTMTVTMLLWGSLLPPLKSRSVALSLLLNLPSLL